MNTQMLQLTKYALAPLNVQNKYSLVR